LVKSKYISIGQTDERMAMMIMIIIIGVARGVHRAGEKLGVIYRGKL